MVSAEDVPLRVVVRSAAFTEPRNGAMAMWLKIGV